MASMVIRKAEFRKSSTRLNQCPGDHLPEFAFIGRSNVGKSSLINFLTGRRRLAKTSLSPGKTTLINHYIINDSWYMVDLPGYGYARVSKKKRESFIKLISDYILKREELLNIFVLLDIRIKPQASDKKFIQWLVKHEIPFAIVFAKTDKVNKRLLNENKQEYFDYLLTSFSDLPKLFFTSIVRKSGRDEILKYIEVLIYSRNENESAGRDQ